MEMVRKFSTRGGVARLGIILLIICATYLYNIASYLYVLYMRTNTISYYVCVALCIS